jgi:hypothetical protein
VAAFSIVFATLEKSASAGAGGPARYIRCINETPTAFGVILRLCIKALSANADLFQTKMVQNAARAFACLASQDDPAISRVRNQYIEVLEQLARSCGLASLINEVLKSRAALREGVNSSLKANVMAPKVDTVRALLDGIDSNAFMLILIAKTDRFIGSASGKFDQKKNNIRAREIGLMLNNAGGINLMRNVHSKVKAAVGGTEARALEMIWNGIGEWLG